MYMIQWIKEIRWGKVLLVGVLFTVLSTVIHQVEAMLTMNYYIDPQYFGVWSKLMMPKAGPPPGEFMLMSLVISFVTGVSVTLIYYYLKDLLPKNTFRRIFLFADLLIATLFIFFTLPVYLMFNVPVGLLVSWFVSSFITLTVASAMIVKIVGK
ncbi:hypothetical protein A2Z00_04805 [Candidatus Gottesmanbacteria bacterium RBG_13_45_10]|uniref:Uncharacterized protein n=1 Tax=Candidatus Gottesmanbacteria bacterium RBG_13_45_10 TaxID=1798370 RepID=A0A1F5ZHF6_9BACT|nr:MAG: hypothetical protein A2Z00_04805 [Candidatus Gottesmanbacteria bacterium RBG_13_45_10]